METPQSVKERREHAERLSFVFSSDNETGELLTVLAAAVRPDARILEIGTGLGVGLAWIVAGVGQRTDVELVTVESDEARTRATQESIWPSWVRFVMEDAVAALPQLGEFDLIFADAEGGKWYGLDITLEALAPNGLLVLDDVKPQPWKTGEEWEEHASKSQEIYEHLLRDERFLTIKVQHGAGVIVAVRRAQA